MKCKIKTPFQLKFSLASVSKPALRQNELILLQALNKSSSLAKESREEPVSSLFLSSSFFEFAYYLL